jgi:hypothetical protein
MDFFTLSENFFKNLFKGKKLAAKPVLLGKMKPQPYYQAPEY